MGWVFENARESFHRYRHHWDELNRSLGNHLLLGSSFVELLIRHFASADTLLGVLKNERNSGMVLAEPVRRGLWQTFQPSQAPLGLILLGSEDDVVVQIRGIIRCLPGYALGLAVLRQDSDFTPFADMTNGDAERLDYITTSRLTLKGTFEGYWKTRSHNLTHNLRRQRRRFAEQAVRLELVTHRGAEHMAEGVRLYGELESAGWKGEEGTAITADNGQGLFYRELLEYFSGRDEGVIYRLDMNGSPIASALCLERSGMLIVLKITYDEKMVKCSPGLLLHEEMLKSVFGESRVHVIEYYGRYSDWHKKWTGETRPMYHFNIYRYFWVETARSLLKYAALDS
jgi:CelD/BcsL family acetyltransferase involved in cellulose biosynthesis